jgi:hypothetical protein
MRRAGSHQFRGGLGEKIWAFQVDRNQPVEALLPCIEKVRAHVWSDSGVVYEQIEPAHFLPDEFDHRRAVLGARYICAHDLDPHVPGASLPAKSRALVGRLLISGVIDDQVVSSAARQRGGDAAADPAGGAGDESYGEH